MSENTTGVGRSATEDGPRSSVRTYWQRFLRWLSGLNGIPIMIGAFALGLLAGQTTTFEPFDGLFFLVGGLFPIFQMLLPEPEQEGGYDYEAPLRDRVVFVGLLLVWSVTPTGLLAQALQIPGNFVPYARYRGRLPNRERHVTETTVSLPFDGTWTTVNGGVTKQTSHSWGLVSQRYAYDFLVTDAEGNTHEGDGDELTDYYAFGEPVRAPAAGTVVATEDSLRDHPWPSKPWMEWRTHRITGNYVIVQHEDGEYSLLAHLKAGSVTVEPGDTVEAGDVVGQCGNSGNTSEPHLHYQLMDHRNFWTAAGLVPRFDGLTISREDDARESHEVYGPVEDDSPTGRYLWAGDRVAPERTGTQASPIPSR